MRTPLPRSVTAGAFKFRRKLEVFKRHQRGAAAVEFAFVSVALIFTVLFTMAVGLIQFLTQQLDFATSKAARQIMIGYVQKNSLTQSAFRTQIVCARLPAFINCGDVIVNVQTVTEARSPAGYYTFVRSDMSGLIIPALTNTTTNYNVGVQGAYVYLQVIYPMTFLPNFMVSLITNGATYKGSPAYLAISTAAFKNEQY